MKGISDHIKIKLPDCFPKQLLWNFFTILHSREKNMRVPKSPHPPQQLALSVFWIIAILTGERWFLIVVLICISTMISDVQHLFMCLSIICISSLDKCLFRSSSPFKMDLFLWHWIVWVLDVFWILNPFWIQCLQISSSIQLTAFLFCWWFPSVSKRF